MMKLKLMLAAGLAVGALGMSKPASAMCGPDPYIGSICHTAANFCPRQYAPADGGIIAINQNSALFSLLGCTYGGDCRSTFGLPDLRGRSVVGEGTAPGLSTVTMGLKRGEEYVTLTAAQMPSHSHEAIAIQDDGTGGEVKVEASTMAGVDSVPGVGSYLGEPRLGNGPGSAPVDLYHPPTHTGTLVELGGVTYTPPVPGQIAVNTYNTGGSQAHSNVPPQLGLLACIAVEGVYPPRN